MELLQRLQIQEQLLHQSFRDKFVADYNLPDFPEVLLPWAEMSYAEFRAECDLIFARTLLSSCTVRDWEEYFAIAQSKARKIRADILATQSQQQNQ